MDCERSVPECFYCGGPHRVGHKECPKQKVEEDICKLKDDKKLTTGWENSNTLLPTLREKKTYADMVKAARDGHDTDKCIQSDKKKTRIEEENETTSKRDGKSQKRKTTVRETQV